MGLVLPVGVVIQEEEKGYETPDILSVNNIRRHDY